MKSPYQLGYPEVLRELQSNAERGLGTLEASARLAQHGPNELVDRGSRGPLSILIEQLTGTLVLILLVAAIVSAFMGDYKDVVAIMVIVVLNAILGFNQEYKAERAMAALKRLSVPTVRVRRGGVVMEISARELVPGDLVLLEPGNLVPADCRIIECASLRVQESALTGESEAVEKFVDALPGENLGVGDRRNMAHMGTAVTYGRAVCVVTATGMNTELGNIATLLQGVEHEATPLQRKLNELGKGLVYASVGLVTIVFVLGMIRGEEWHVMFLTAVSLAVAAVPEGLPAVVTIALALGAQKMLRRNALIRKLPAVESLGAVTVICSDKTGTLTANRMTVTMLDVAGHRIDLSEQLRDFTPVLEDDMHHGVVSAHPGTTLLLGGAVLCNDAVLRMDKAADGVIPTVGDPTESALLVAGARHSLDKNELDRFFPRLAEIPFDSIRKRMSTIHSLNHKPGHGEEPVEEFRTLLSTMGGATHAAFVKGAVDGMLDISAYAWDGNEIHAMDDQTLAQIQDAHAGLAEDGMRVLGVGIRLGDETLIKLSGEDVERDLIFVGLVGLIDPARPEARESVATCTAAGIRPIMITGDHPLTAKHIAQKLGIPTGGTILTGKQLETLSPQDLRAAVPHVSVYARVSPEHKLKIVEALQDTGEIVAMTGDGVNDAPALKKADIGVAMGISGTDVSKEAADVILLDDNFATIVAAVEEGRIIFDNIRKFLKYMLTSNSGELWVMLVAPFLGMPLPLLPIQILWINLVTDGLPALALGVEPAERFIMHRPPHDPNEGLFARGLGRHVILGGMLMGLTPLMAGYVMYVAGNPHWQTMLFTVLTLSQMGHVMAVRSERDSLFTIGIFSNMFLFGSVMMTFVLQFGIIYIADFHAFFNTSFLTLNELLVALGLSSVIFWAVELEKVFTRKKAVS